MKANKKNIRMALTQLFKLIGFVVEKFWSGIIIIAIAGSILSFYIAKDMNLNPNIIKLLPANDPDVINFLETAKNFGFTEKLLVFIKVKASDDQSLVKNFMEAYGARLNESNLINNVEFKLPAISFNQSEEKIIDKFDLRETYYETSSQDGFLMFVYPAGDSTDFIFSRKLLKEVAQIEKSTKGLAEYKNVQLNVSYGGGYVISIEEADNIEHNVKNTILISTLFILILFLFAFRRIHTVIWVGICLLMSIIWTFLAAFIVINSLNVMTVAFAVILAGLGIDFGIHIMNRYEFEINSGVAQEKALKSAILNTGESIFFSCLTTALAFYSLQFTNFKGIEEFGFIIGTGIIFSMVSMLIVLPSFLMFEAKFFPKRKISKNFFTLRKIGLFLDKNAESLSVTLIIVFISCAVFIFKTYDLPKFDNSLDNMSAVDNQGIIVQKEIMNEFGNYFEPIAIIVKNKDPDKIIPVMQSIQPTIEVLTEQGVFARYENIFKYLPSMLTNQAQTVDRVNFPSPEKAVNYLLRKLKREKSKEEEYEYILQEKDRIINFLTKYKNKQEIKYQDFAEIMPKILFHKFFAFNKTTNEYSIISYVYPVKRITTKPQLNNLINSLNIQDVDVNIVGLSLLVGKLEYIIKREVKYITCFIFIALLLVLGCIYQDLSLVLISVIPLILSLLATVFAMSLLNKDFNYMNIIAFPLIIGIGIDDSIHMISQFLKNNQKSVFKMVEETGRGVLITSLTTMIGFGSLIFTRHSGLISLGFITFVGVFICLVSSLFVLPGLLVMVTKVRK